MSSLLRSHFLEGEATWVDLLDPELCNELNAYPNRLLQKIEGTGKRGVVIDEVQKVPKLLEIVQQKIFKKNTILRSPDRVLASSNEERRTSWLGVRLFFISFR